jgi:acetylornithine deacetylase
MLNFLHDILTIDSTSGQEENLADFITTNYKPQNAVVEIQLIPNGKKNVYFKWGDPKIIFCSHLDTVPPYIAPSSDATTIYGRGACDAKGQIAVIYQACQELSAARQTDFGMLLLAGEEEGSYGAEVANQLISGCNYVIVCEPTGNKLISAAKGNLLFAGKIIGKTAHSGYPELGVSALETFHAFLNELAALDFPKDKMLGATTYNIGLLHSDNACNVIPDKITFNLLFRTTFATCNILQAMVTSLANEYIEINCLYGDLPQQFYVLPGFATDVVAFGSDAPKLFNLGKPLLYGPGSILVAHSTHEQVAIADLERAVIDLQKIYYTLSKEIKA